MLISVGILFTVTLTVVVFNAYVPSPPTLTVMIAVPAPTALTLPWASTVATDSLLDVYVTFKPSGVVSAIMVKLSLTFKSKVLLLTLTLASFKLTVTVMVLFLAAA